MRAAACDTLVGQSGWRTPFSNKCVGCFTPPPYGALAAGNDPSWESYQGAGCAGNRGPGRAQYRAGCRMAPFLHFLPGVMRYRPELLQVLELLELLRARPDRRRASRLERRALRLPPHPSPRAVSVRRSGSAALARLYPCGACWLVWLVGWGCAETRAGAPV